MKKIIRVDHGGLGDNLQFSRFPELYKKMGHEVFLWSGNQYRNEEIKDLVWNKNPFVDGETAETPNAGHAIHLTDYTEHMGMEGRNFLERFEYLEGFKINLDEDPPLPKIYYKPKEIKEVKDSVLIDLGCLSLGSGYTDVKKYIEEYFLVHPSRVGLLNNNIYHLKSRDNEKLNKSFGVLEGVPHKKYSNIYEYVDLIYSCKRYICLWSGGHSLAAAVNAKNTTCLMLREEFHEGMFHFFNIDYIPIPEKYIEDNEGKRNHIEKLLK